MHSQRRQVQQVLLAALLVAMGVCAAALILSARSLQRHLAAHDSGFGVLLRQVRLARSARLLAETPQSPAQIGYVCGFSDQAHFTREFKRHSAVTPLRFRQQFALAR